MLPKILLLFTFTTVIGSIYGYAQSTLQFTIIQPTTISIDAGQNRTIIPGDTTVIGGETSAIGGTKPISYSWVPSTGLDSTNVPNPLAFPDSTTTYTLTVEDASGCTKSSSMTVTVDRTNSMQNMANEYGLTVYPNPNKGDFHIFSTRPLDTRFQVLRVYDPVGRLITQRNILPDSRNLKIKVVLPQKTRGVYLLNIVGRDVYVSSKFIIR